MQTNKIIFIDEVLKTYILPLELRDNSKTKNGERYTTGTRIPLNLGNNNFIRLFQAWGVRPTQKYPNGFLGDLHVDIDLSAGFITKDEKSFQRIAYYAQHNGFASHSGDFTRCDVWDETNVTAEFIDIDIKLAKKEARYIMASSIIFADSIGKNNFNTGIKCLAGLMFIDNRASTNQNIDISNAFWTLELVGEEVYSYMPLIIDLETEEIIVIDQYSEGKERGLSIDACIEDLSLFKSKYLEATKTQENMFDFISLYCKANNIQITQNKEEATLVVSCFDDLEKPTFNVGKNLENILKLLD